jgi:hypothetical protein
MLSYTGRRNTAPDTPIVAVTVEISNPAVKPSGAVPQVLGSTDLR